MKIIVGIWSIFPIFSIIGIIVALNGGGEDGLLPISIGLLVLSLCLPTIIFHIFHKEIKQFFVKHKKNFVWTVSLSVVVLAIVAANHRERELLLQESIDAFKTGDFEKAQNGFEILQDKMDDPDLETIYSFVVTMQLWQSEDTDKKLEAVDQARGVNTYYDGLLAEDIHLLANSIVEEGAKLYSQLEAERLQQEEALLQRISNGKPYVGMDVKYINKTSLGNYDKTGTNERKESINGRTITHKCTLYYWMDGSSCIFIARVQNDIGEVIYVDDHPAGSYFGN